MRLAKCILQVFLQLFAVSGDTLPLVGVEECKNVSSYELFISLGTDGGSCDTDLSFGDCLGTCDDDPSCLAFEYIYYVTQCCRHKEVITALSSHSDTCVYMADATDKCSKHDDCLDKYFCSVDGFCNQCGVCSILHPIDGHCRTCGHCTASTDCAESNYCSKLGVCEHCDICKTYSNSIDGDCPDCGICDASDVQISGILNFDYELNGCYRKGGLLSEKPFYVFSNPDRRPPDSSQDSKPYYIYWIGDWRISAALGSINVLAFSNITDAQFPFEVEGTWGLAVRPGLAQQSVVDVTQISPSSTQLPAKSVSPPVSVSCAKGDINVKGGNSGNIALQGLYQRVQVDPMTNKTFYKSVDTGATQYLHWDGGFFFWCFSEELTSSEFLAFAYGDTEFPSEVNASWWLKHEDGYSQDTTLSMSCVQKQGSSHSKGTVIVVIGILGVCLTCAFTIFSASRSKYQYGIKALIGMYSKNRRHSANNARHAHPKQIEVDMSGEGSLNAPFLEEPVFYERVHGKRLALLIGNGNGGKIQDTCHRDVRAIENTLRLKGDIDVKVYYDLNSEHMELFALECSKETGYDCFIFFFSGHGNGDGIYGDDENLVSMDKIVDYFQPGNCRSFIGMPKIFLLDCCRGPRVDSLSVRKTSDKMPQSLLLNDQDVSQHKSIAPRFVDFVYGYASAPSFKSYAGNKTTNNLSVWTFYLTERLTKHPRMSFLNILILVQRDVQLFCRQYPDKAQSANSVNYLTRRVTI